MQLMSKMRIKNNKKDFSPKWLNIININGNPSFLKLKRK